MMNELHPYRAVIQSVPDSETRPLWSVMIPTYNCANYLRETLASVLAQAPGADVMQIEVVDDHSTKDDPEAVVRELAGDRVSFYRQPENVGHIRNFNTCLQRSRGHLIHLLHGDDCVQDSFYQKMQQSFEKYSEVRAAFCRYIGMDEHGHWLWLPPLQQIKSGILENWLEQIAVINHLQPPSMVVRRDVYEKLGGYDSRLSQFAEDWEMWVRIAAQYQVWYEVEPLAIYRIHSSSLTGYSIRTGQNVRDIRQAIEIIQPYLPKSISNKLYIKARENWALYAISDITPRLFAIGDLTAAITQIQEALRCSYSLKVIQALIFVLPWRTGKTWLKKTRP
ncbi:glycosyltransferase family 2 protein [Nostoc sp. DedSLP04]|uniref:glycosyltransferase family 2 protein n=1 Tax=Nostoc sp. DedSLP04 TaxID=3075401 RepID=UPI002AD4A2BC|nr:glycosyltransferase [Nostoc sp. DedSLP04]MDZ8033137.1 glycosyltransferase [Nostoc sp. DedSLP04]